MTLDLSLIREQVPALQKDAIFLDNPAGTQVPQVVLNRMTTYLTETNANHAGAFATSRLSDAVLDEAHAGLRHRVPAHSDQIQIGPTAKERPRQAGAQAIA